jgi:5'-3' exoribonuclease 2
MLPNPNFIGSLILKFKLSILNISISYGSLEGHFLLHFTFICYFLGNDFLPHIPSLDISKDGIDILLNIYAETWNNFFDYAVEATLDDFKINQSFIQMFLNNLSLKEHDILVKKK